MKDVVVVGAGLAGLSAAWKLRGQDIAVLEADTRFGGRIQSQRQGDYWMNWGGHVFAGHNSSTDELLVETGVDAVAVPGSLQAMSMNGKFLRSGHIATYPFRIPMSLGARIGTMYGGLKVVAGVAKYVGVVRKREGETGPERQQRIYDFENTRTFQDFIGNLPADAASLFQTTVTRSSGNMDQISAGAGIGYFSLVLGFGQGLNRGIVGGPSTLTGSIAATLGERLQLGAEVYEVVEKPHSVVVRYRQNGQDHEVEAKSVVLATTANISRKVGVTLADDVRDALSQVKYGPHVSTAFLTNESGKRPWDDIYAIAAPKRSFAIALNQASIVRGSEGDGQRKPGGSFMTFSPAALGAALLHKPEQEVIDTHLKDLEAVLDYKGFSDSVVEAKMERWENASPYCAPGRAKLQPVLMRNEGRVFLAGDFLGTLYTETSITTGFTAAERALQVLSA
jgi:protoporphyrinogen/coproporphyrinogen III oxidase